MRRLRRFALLPWAQKSQLLRALLVVTAARLALWLLPIGAVRRIALSDREKVSGANSIAELVWAVKAVSRYVPAATCLTQALALQWLLARSGHTSRIHLGARKNLKGKFQAHAWVECEDRLVMGGREAHKYVPLTAWQKSSG